MPSIINLLLNVRTAGANGVTSLSNSIRGLAAEYLAYKSVVELVQKAGERATTLKETAILADRLGLSMRDLSAAQYAAFKAGNVNAEGFASALDDLNEKIQDFALNGAGEAVDMFEKLDLKIKDMRLKTPLEQMLAIADAAKGLSKNERSQLFDQLGSDNLRALSSVLKDGGKEFRNLMKEAKDAGVAINDIDARKIIELKNEASKASGLFATIFDSAIAGASPRLAVLLDDFSNALKKLKGDGANVTFLDTTIKYLQNASTWVAVLFSNLFHSVKVFGLGVADLFANVIGTTLQSFIKVGQTVLSSLNGILNGMREALAKGAELVGKKGIADKLRAEDWGIDTQGLDAGYKKIEEVKKKLDDLFLKNLKYMPGDSIKAYNTMSELMIEAKAKQMQADAERAAADAAHNQALKQSLASAEAERRMHLAFYKINAELEKRQGDARIASLENDRAMRLEELARMNQAELNALGGISKAKLDLEKETNAKITAERLKQYDVDIALAKKAKEEIDAKVANYTERDIDYNTSLAEQATQQAAINKLVDERTAVELAGKRQNALLDIQSAATQQEIHDAKMELLSIEGKEYELSINQIDDQYRDLLAKLKAGSEEAGLVEKLISTSKAKVLLDELKRQFDELNTQLARGEISQDDYKARLGELAPKMEDAAQGTGNTQVLADTNRELKDAANNLDTIFQSGKLVGESLQGGMVDALFDIASKTKDAKDAFRGMASAILIDLTKMIAKALMFKALNAAFGGGGGGGGFWGGMAQGVATHHSGGIAGVNPGRTSWINPMAFLGAVKYHSGGIVGFKPNEVPAVLEKDEEVLKRTDPRHRYNLGGGGSTAQPITINNSIDTASIASAMEGAEGAKMVINHIKANASTIKAHLT